MSRLLVQPLVQLSPAWRRLVLVLIDLALLPLAGLLTFLLLETEPLAAAFSRFDWILPGLMTIGLALYLYTGQYKGITRYTSGRSIYALALRNLAVVAGVIVEGALFQLPMPPIGFWGLLWFLLIGFTSLTRFLLQDLLHISQRVEQHHRVVIYGAGGAGAQLAASLQLHPEYRIVAFIDDDPALWNRHLHGVMVTSPSQLPTLRQRYRIDQVMLALPSISRSHCRQIVRVLQQQGLSVLQVPSLGEISSGKARIDAVRPVAIEDLLGRDPVAPDPNLLAEAVTGRSVLVSGAGGSIGSELCRQILKLRPRQLLLLEISEPALYEIDQELKALQANQSSGDVFRPEILPVLGSVLDAALLERVFGDHRVHVVFHAAAYKHVPLVEMNPMAGLSNNVLGTRTIAEMAVRAGVEHFLMISTDKAVRPTNVMGASKRLAELVVQGIARRTSNWAQAAGQSRPRTNFALVRFGNVLGSSGSVVPLFRRQIAEGGPITLTHPEIIRYFMTIPEAVQLVLQASALAERDTQADPELHAEADVFLLDMGEPVRIVDLARQMVRLSGLSLRDSDNPAGDIEIKFTGLRPGEKLYEELLISGDAEGTGHPLIFRAPEAANDHIAGDEQLWPHLDDLAQALDHHELSTALELLSILVPEWSGGDGGNDSRRKTSPIRKGSLRVLQTPTKASRNHVSDNNGNSTATLA
ncbi:MAG: nucleoside-diphosphate sugar epimerase/dehydratase [Prochlorococcaceae cyanobacterium]